MLETTRQDKDKLQSLLTKLGLEMPNIKYSFYKNRGNKWKGFYLWVNANKGICRFDPVFATTWTYELIDIEDIKIIIQEE